MNDPKDEIKEEVHSVIDNLVDDVEIVKDKRDNVTTPSDSEDTETDQATNDANNPSIKKEKKSKKTVLKVLAAVITSGALIGLSYKTYHAYEEEKLGLINRLVLAENSMQILNKSIIDLKAEDEMLRTSQTTLSDLKEENLKLNENMANISLTYSALDSDILRINSRLDDLAVQINEAEGFGGELEAIKKEVENLKKNIIRNKAAATKRRISSAKPNLKILSVDWWDGAPQAVILTNAGTTIFLSEGEKFEKWSVTKIDAGAGKVSFTDGRKTHTLRSSL